MTRLLAILAAVGMVVGAFVYRYGVPGSGGSGGNRTDGGGANVAGAVVCASELGAVCDAVPDALVEPAGVTADRLVKARGAGDAGITGWLAPGPWPAMVDDARTRSSKVRLFASKGAGLASSPIVAVARKGQLPPACAAAVTWKCLGDAAQDPSFGLGGDARATPDGLFLRAAALGGFLGRTDYATNDLTDSPDATTWLGNLDDRLGAAASFGAQSLNDFLVISGTVKVYLVGGAAANSLRTNPAFEVHTPTPAATVAVVYTATSRNGRQIDRDPVTKTLTAAGWKVQPNARTEGLPSPGVLLALRSS